MSRLPPALLLLDRAPKTCTSLTPPALQVLANKNDLDDHATVDEVIKALALSTITNREVSCYSISAKSSRNIDITLAWCVLSLSPVA